MVSRQFASVAALLEDKVVKDCPMPLMPPSVLTSTINIRLGEGTEPVRPALVNGILIMIERTLVIFILELR
jgi:hypothetical protein